MDRHSTPEFLVDVMPIMRQARGILGDCDAYLFCGMPFYTTRMHRQMEHSYWIPMASSPQLSRPITVQRVTDGVPANRLELSLTGPHQMGILISPHVGVEITGWNLLDHVPVAGHDWNGRKTYFVRYVAGTIHPMTVRMDLSVPNNWTGPRVSVSVTGHYTDYDNEATPAFRQFVNSYPAWAHVTAWMSAYHGYEF